MSNCNSFNVPSGCCDNPCAVTQVNTAACESLPSQISNFTAQFFGTVVKTETDGVVSWSLPCGLDVGLPNNPRAADEGLACYFLRLFSDGITGLTGPAGPAGSDGSAGNNAYTVTLQNFAQPTQAAPHIQVLTAFNPAILNNTYIFIGTSGWYFVDDYDPSGMAFLTLAQAVAGASGTIAAGKLVIPAGFVGPAGPQGVQGAQGPPGLNTFATNAFYSAPAGTDYNVQVTYQGVDFIASAPRVLLPVAGTYMLTAVVDVVGLAGVVFADSVSLKLFNTIAAADVAGSEHFLSGLAVNQRSQVVLNAIVTTTADSQEIGLYARASSANVFAAVALNTSLSLIRLA